MELSTPLMGIIFIVAMLAPVAYLIMSAMGKDKKVIKSVKQLSQAQGVNLKTIDVIGNCVIGVDEVSKKLVFTSKRNPSEDLKIINMENVKECRSKTIRQTDKTLDWVGLELTENTGKQEIQFYNEHDDNELSRDPHACLQQAKRWENILQPLLKAS